MLHSASPVSSMPASDSLRRTTGASALARLATNQLLRLPTSIERFPNGVLGPPGSEWLLHPHEAALAPAPRLADS